MGHAVGQDGREVPAAGVGRPMTLSEQAAVRRGFRDFFLRGLAILLPTILTIWIIIAAYSFVRDNIAEPINWGIREVVVRWTSYPYVAEIDELKTRSAGLKDEAKTAYELSGFNDEWLQRHYKRLKLAQQWDLILFPMNLIGVLLAIVVIYFVGRFVGSYIGSRLHRRGERLLSRVPVIKQVYPYVKQVTDFVVGSDREKNPFKRVVAVEYPRLGLWSVGLVTGEAMRSIGARSDKKQVTVFIPSSPTPFTGYVITVAEDETIAMPLTIEQALKFTISGGVLTPPSELPAAGPHELPGKVAG